MLHVQHFLLIGMCFTGAYSAPDNKQNFNGIRAGSFYNHVSSPQNVQNLEGWTGVPNPRNIQTFRNAHVRDTFYNDVPRTGNVQDFTGLKAEGDFVDVNSNGRPSQIDQNLRNRNENDQHNFQTFYNDEQRTGNVQNCTGLKAEGDFVDVNSNGRPSQNDQDLRNRNENDQHNFQTFQNAQIGGKFYNDVPRTGNVQDFSGLKAEGGVVDVNSNGRSSQNDQDLRNRNDNDQNNFQTFQNGGKFYNDVPRTGNVQDCTGLKAEDGFVDVNSNGATQRKLYPRNQYDDFINRRSNQNFEDVKIDGDFYNVVRSGAARDTPQVNHQNGRSRF